MLLRYFSFLQRTGRYAMIFKTHAYLNKNNYSISFSKSLGTGYSNAMTLDDWTKIHSIFAFDLTVNQEGIYEL